MARISFNRSPHASAAGWADAIDRQTAHATWSGFSAWDFVGPMFLFVVGAAMPFAVAARAERELSLQSIYGRIARRFVHALDIGADC